VFTQHDPALILREAQRLRIHRADTIAVLAPEPALIAALAARLERAMDWELVYSGGQIYVSEGGRHHEGALARHALVS